MFYYNELVPLEYIHSNFQFDKKSCKSTFEYMYTLGGFVTTSKVIKEVIWFNIFFKRLGYFS